MATEDLPWPERHFDEDRTVVADGIFKQTVELIMVGGEHMVVEFGANPDLGVWIDVPVLGRLVSILVLGPYRDEPEDPMHRYTANILVDENDPFMSIDLHTVVEDYPAEED